MNHRGHRVLGVHREYSVVSVVFVSSVFSTNYMKRTEYTTARLFTMQRQLSPRSSLT